MLVELILLNRDLGVGEAPWRGEHRVWWGKTVAAINKLIKVHGLTTDQLAFYVYRCNPVDINPQEFAKMAVVAKKLFRRHDLADLVRMYQNRREKVQNTGGTERAGYAEARPKRKSLAAFLEELENE